MATNKGLGKKKEILDGDNPPILVGGGGSSLIWIKKIYNPKLINPLGVDPDAPQPTNQDEYYCFQIDQDITSVTVKNGMGGSNGHTVNNKKFKVNFT
jgi:hypothetical protein